VTLFRLLGRRPVRGSHLSNNAAAFVVSHPGRGGAHLRGHVSTESRVILVGDAMPDTDGNDQLRASSAMMIHP